MDGEAAANPGLVGPDGQPIPGAVDENGNPIQAPEAEKVEEVIPEEILEDMKNVWSVFDLEQQESVEICHLRVIMRALDFDLSPEELAIVRENIDPTGTGTITFANLKKVMEQKLKDTDTPEDMIAQLKHLDRDKDGQIALPEFKQYMQNLGMKMTNEQIEEFMKTIDTKGDGMIYIEDVAAILCPPKPPKK